MAIRLQVPHVRQTGPDCWFLSLEMIRAYHNGGLNWDFRVLELMGGTDPTVKDFPDGVSPEHRRTRFPGWGFQPVPYSRFSQDGCSAAHLEEVLREYGPLYCAEQGTVFGQANNHANVICGVDPSTDRYWVNDPSWNEPAREREYDYLLMLIGLFGPAILDRNHPPLWYYAGQDRRRNHG